MNELIKYNFGGGLKKIDGFLNVDILEWSGITDIIWDLTKVPYDFVKELVDEILAMEILEHISFRNTEDILKEWYRILKPGGKLIIQVPDCGKMMKYYKDGLVCDCVPHKAISEEYFKADEKCWKCKGRAKVNTDRWLFSFIGAQKHEYDTHKSIFTKEKLQDDLQRAGFRNIIFKKNIYKLVAICIK